MVHKWCPAFKNLCSRSGSKINILAPLKLPQIYIQSPAECGRAEHHARARQKENFTKCHAWRLLCQKPGSYPDFQMTFLLALRCSQCYCSPPCWCARRSSALLNEWGMEMAEQLSKIIYDINKMICKAQGFSPCFLIPHAPNMKETCSTCSTQAFATSSLFYSEPSATPTHLPEVLMVMGHPVPELPWPEQSPPWRFPCEGEQAESIRYPCPHLPSAEGLAAFYLPVSRSLFP